MAEEIMINVSTGEIRVAVVEQRLLQEIFIERTKMPTTVGNIYKGEVIRILPGMQSAFVDIGQNRAAFIHVTDLIDNHVPMLTADKDLDLPEIQTILRQGQAILVQTTKEPLGSKGARVTTNLSLASRLLVYMPEIHHIGISQKIEAEEERERLRQIVDKFTDSSKEDGFIVRTAAENATSEDLAADAKLIIFLWKSIENRTKSAATPSLLYEDLPIYLRVIRDLINLSTTKIIVDSNTVFKKIQAFLAEFIPEMQEMLTLYNEDLPLFDIHNLEDQIEHALDRNVPLKSGGYLVIDQTEAMTTIDVNTGAFVGRKDLEETIYRTNLEAAAAIPRQLRLRNLGGIVILDFIDMAVEEHKRQVLRILEKGQAHDRARCKVSQISELGLVEMTRKRTHESLSRMLCEPCNVCAGTGMVKTTESVCLEIFRQIQRKARDFANHECMVMGSQSVIDRLLDEDAQCVEDLAKAIAADIRIQVEPSYAQDQFDVVLI